MPFVLVECFPSWTNRNPGPVQCMQANAKYIDVIRGNKLFYVRPGTDTETNCAQERDPTMGQSSRFESTMVYVHGEMYSTDKKGDVRGSTSQKGYQMVYTAVKHNIAANGPLVLSNQTDSFS